MGSLWTYFALIPLVFVIAYVMYGEEFQRGSLFVANQLFEIKRTYQSSHTSFKFFKGNLSW